MNEARDDLLEFAKSGELSSRVTTERVRDALSDFPLVPVKSHDWIAEECRVAIAMFEDEYLAAELSVPGMAEVRKALGDAASRVSALRKKIAPEEGREKNKGLHPDVDAYLRNFSLCQWLGRSDAISRADSHDEYQRYTRLFNEDLFWLEDYFNRAAEAAEPETTRWRDQKRQQARFSVACALIRVFESAYDQNATLPHDKDSLDHGPFAEFYARILRVAGMHPGEDRHIIRNALKDRREGRVTIHFKNSSE